MMQSIKQPTGKHLEKRILPKQHSYENFLFDDTLWSTFAWFPLGVLEDDGFVIGSASEQLKSLSMGVWTFVYLRVFKL